MPPMLLTILTLAVLSQHASNAHYHPYACGVPSQNACDAAYHPYACIMTAQHSSDAPYHPYAHGMPYQHASDLCEPLRYYHISKKVTTKFL
ncbi:hypothetical protein O181_121975 [Austropuccinia psidii MF-1]|uniref:Secreted protein n=1 Tax=Austropuccinia psidii MF-1 TaxID=1389203 RepID=A0A9Q3Q2T7_9BASI|nr:hypothetical protein [Austropuccinia psidii MF-1]